MKNRDLSDRSTTASKILGRTLSNLPSRRLQLALAIFVLALLLFLSSGFRLQLTGSGPRGIWQFKDSDLALGSWVAICAEPPIAMMARERGYLAKGPCTGDVTPMLKRVAALPGDVVDLGPAGVAINGQLLPGTPVLPTDREGRPLPHPDWGQYAVAPGTLWVINTKRDSFDSRYFGPVDATRVLSVADAVLVQGEESR